MMTTHTARMRDGRSVVITDNPKPGMSIFTMFGYIDGDFAQPLHFTGQGAFRADGKPDHRDIVKNVPTEPVHSDVRDLAEMVYAQPNRFLAALNARR
jgi:hypothetical protein